MKFVKKSLFLTAFLTMSMSAYALKGDTDQPINIDSGSQSLDMDNNVVVFTDNVLITQGSIKITANKVTITRQEGKKEKIDANGSPVTFQQTLDNGKPVNGKASSVNYDLGSEFLTLIGNAELKQLDSFIKAERITYDVKKQQLKATSGGKSRVKTVLIPTQLQENKQNSKKK
ncbi:lipopolysaccharide transport periplasmic protein LptA [Ursidibacter maritimus]|uniref:Lipopolysaccharide export system protein LptA n=1 Tax=Ursidibacter maritimus TaxID=1331689 RepID=A0A949T4C9_9PAST|nr:lipopolysaccharide transport periplasmic protein LptA [Ursidibacter maritimus]KAE9538979.1 lipopolysaccharide transport periplasmic protein LptA [Ursidibacter maritimus]MBV6524670.1 lipopolysaccharide transport periplasmic protein LptA [Ursidibacter maritimus]MBV6525996.1 lipopolysaccharide transport periplasmic protein LptA [Ursidibacter maritimus]MBV6527911.1 lipopolysaccharide transport periplasmic protein LptA [Ursidibacter maritimus]MBV6528850.1 lipopolysaccharide transport periplasmic